MFCTATLGVIMRTIARSSTRKIADIRSAAVRASVSSLGNGFIAQTIDVDVAFSQLDRLRSAKLTDRENGTYVISVHGNLWYTLYTSAD
jgi:hypothetical protein